MATVQRGSSIAISLPSFMPEDRVKPIVTIGQGAPQKPQDLPASLFKSTTIFISVDDKAVYNAVASAMIRVGATLCTSSVLLADLVITDDKSYSIPKIRSGRGAKLVGANAKNAKIVLVRQIPWVFAQRSVIKKPPSVYQKVERIVKALVVVDDTARFRPMFKEFTEPVKLYFPKKKMKWLTGCPFTPVPETPKNAVEKVRTERIVVPAGPMDKGYCELCNMQYESAEEHHACFDHKRNSGYLKWIEFDDLASILNAKMQW